MQLIKVVTLGLSAAGLVAAVPINTTAKEVIIGDVGYEGPNGAKLRLQEAAQPALHNGPIKDLINTHPRDTIKPRLYLPSMHTDSGSHISNIATRLVKVPPHKPGELGYTTTTCRKDPGEEVVCDDGVDHPTAMGQYYKEHPNSFYAPQGKWWGSD